MARLRLRVISPADGVSQGQEGRFKIRLLLLHGCSWMRAATLAAVPHACSPSARAGLVVLA